MSHMLNDIAILYAVHQKMCTCTLLHPAVDYLGQHCHNAEIIQNTVNFFELNIVHITLYYRKLIQMTSVYCDVRSNHVDVLCVSVVVTSCDLITSSHVGGRRTLLSLSRRAHVKHPVT